MTNLMNHENFHSHQENVLNEVVGVEWIVFPLNKNTLLPIEIYDKYILSLKRPSFNNNEILYLPLQNRLIHGIVIMYFIVFQSTLFFSIQI